MAQQADKLSVVRSFAHSNSGHGGGTHWVMTGYNFPPADNGQAPIKPGFGSILARHRGANNPKPACRLTFAWAASSATARPGSARLRALRHRRQCPQQHGYQGHARSA